MQVAVVVEAGEAVGDGLDLGPAEADGGGRAAWRASVSAALACAALEPDRRRRPAASTLTTATTAPLSSRSGAMPETQTPNSSASSTLTSRRRAGEARGQLVVGQPGVAAVRRRRCVGPRSVSTTVMQAGRRRIAKRRDEAHRRVLVAQRAQRGDDRARTRAASSARLRSGRAAAGSISAAACGGELGRRARAAAAGARSTRRKASTMRGSNCVPAQRSQLGEALAVAQGAGGRAAGTTWRRSSRPRTSRGRSAGSRRRPGRRGSRRRRSARGGGAPPPRARRRTAAARSRR